MHVEMSVFIWLVPNDEGVMMIQLCSATPVLKVSRLVADRCGPHNIIAEEERPETGRVPLCKDTSFSTSFF